MVLLEAKNITKSFGGVAALCDGNLTCRKGKITGLLGANGSGKSTISKIITGVYLGDGGTVTYNGNEVSYKNPIDAKRAGISMAFQNLSLLPDLTVWQNIVLSFEKKNKLFLDNKDAKELSQKILDEFMPGFDIERRVSELDSSEMQIVEIAKAISEDPQLLILDEPTAALEQAQVKALFKYMRKLAEQGVAMIFTSHRLWEVLEMCDDIVVFRNGSNVGEIDFENQEKNPDEIVRLITGDTDCINTVKEYKTVSAEAKLKIEDLNYGKYLQSVSLEVKKGEVLGIGGLAGQGQTELMLALAGNYKEAKCSATINGEPIKLTQPANAVRKGILLVPGDRQKEGLMLKDSVYTNMIFPKLALKKQPLITPTKKYREECEQIVKTLSIKTASIDLAVDKLSGGNQQKVVVGKWLPFDTNVLLLADPAKGVDVGAKHDLYEFIMKMVEEKNMSVILYASDNDELVSYCDRVLVMYEGKIVGELKGKEISDEAIVEMSLQVKSKEEGEVQ
ncbi:MAG: sugar ABC transporter ATP-binding protein [Christensenella sp.]|uniref:sugar ABC transporter ATP-binding protein n=1 Tax=Christensenella sp. TaxID=1935934 RepID=UPI002B1E911F|nr:sugar ABC transporter ATP-binding protein [Christensenella sp.]MEA5002984.1 sugar ABC transporter ATP-binding protein [Christensenella sp.]